MLATADLDFPLPDELIARSPAEPRDSARLLVVRRSAPDVLEDRVFRELDEILRPIAPSPDAGASPPEDLLVLNATRVLPARFLGVRTDTGGHAEGLYLGPAAGEPHAAPAHAARHESWLCLIKMRRAKPGVRVELLAHDGSRCGVELELVKRASDDGVWLAMPRSTLSSEDIASGILLERIGLTPIPPYILASRKAHDERADDRRDRADYQTVYAVGVAEDQARAGGLHGSVAAPTAGLHFTQDLLSRLEARAVRRTQVMLDVGMGTFKPVETEFVEHHPMHAEFCCVPPEAIRAITTTRERGGRVIAVGTTAARTLESFDDRHDLELRGPTEHHTRLLITPGWRWRFVDGLITNFHLPRTTLLAMVAAMLHVEGEDPRTSVERLRAIYAHAVREKYRFYSFGDAMVILQ